jgi:hypothetical protein
MANTTPKKTAKVRGKVNPPALKEAKPTIRLSATLSLPQATEDTGSGALLTLPDDGGAKLPPKDTTIVEGTINGFPFRAALKPNGSGSHLLMITKALRDAAGADIGDTVTVEITRVGEESECRVPVDLRKALEASPSAQAGWTDITSMARRDWVLSIISVKQEETRKRRIEITCDKLASGMRRPCCFPGINWRRKDSEVTSEETWLPLPNSKSRASARSRK